MINSIAILGAGTMGRTIASFFSQNGIKTRLYDPFEKALVLAHKKLENCLDLEYTLDLQQAVSDADFVIESAPEEISVKKQLYSAIAPFLDDQAIVGSNTSTYSLKTLSEDQPFASRMLITHFFNPADIIPLVEIVQHPDTLPDTAETIAAFLRELGKVPVILKKDMKGFIANRLQAAVLREACYLLEEGVADARDIDTVMKESIGARWALSGPFEIADYGGLDIWEKVLTNLLPGLNDSIEVPSVISQKVTMHNLGLKSGKGFFNHDMQSGKEKTEDWNKKLIEILKVTRVKK